MHKFLVLIVVIGGSLLTGCTTTKTEPQYAGTALFPPIQTPQKATPIMLGRTSILWGDHDVVHGADFGGIGNFVNKEFRGSAASLVFHSTSGKARISGLQLSGVANLNHGDTKVEGFQMAAGMNYAGNVQKTYGIQLAALNIGMKNKIYGFQVGLYNEAEAIYGFQIGVVNRTKSLYGVQIGVVNMSSKNGLAFCPILNVGF